MTVSELWAYYSTTTICEIHEKLITAILMQKVFSDISYKPKAIQLHDATAAWELCNMIQVVYTVETLLNNNIPTKKS